MVREIHPAAPGCGRRPPTGPDIPVTTTADDRATAATARSEPPRNLPGSADPPMVVVSGSARPRLNPDPERVPPACGAAYVPRSSTNKRRHLLVVNPAVLMGQGRIHEPGMRVVPAPLTLEPALHRAGQQVHDQQRPDQGERDDPDPLDPPRHVRLAHDVHQRDQPHREERDDDDQEVGDLGRRHSAAQPFPATSPRSATRAGSSSCRGRRVRRQRCQSSVRSARPPGTAPQRRTGRAPSPRARSSSDPSSPDCTANTIHSPRNSSRARPGTTVARTAGAIRSLLAISTSRQGHGRGHEPDQRERGEQDHQRRGRAASPRTGAAGSQRWLRHGRRSARP